MLPEYIKVVVSPILNSPRMVQTSKKPQTLACPCLSPSVHSANLLSWSKLGALRHIPHTIQAKDVSARSTGQTWSYWSYWTQHDPLLMQHCSTMVGRDTNVILASRSTLGSTLLQNKEQRQCDTKGPRSHPLSRAACGYPRTASMTYDRLL